MMASKKNTSGLRMVAWCNVCNEMSETCKIVIVETPKCILEIAACHECRSLCDKDLLTKLFKKGGPPRPL